MLQFRLFGCQGTTTIRRSLVQLVIACILPLAGIAAFLIYNFYQREQAQLAVDATNRARATVFALDRDIEMTQAALQALATSNRLRTGDLAGFYLRATAELKNLRVTSIIVLDSSGQLLLSTSQPFGSSLPKINNSMAAKHIFETATPGISDPFIGPLIERHIYTIGVPVLRYGKVIYTLHATLMSDHLDLILKQQKIPDSWRAAIIDSSGLVVRRSHESDKYLGRKVDNDILVRMHVSNEDSFTSKTLDGIPVLSAYSRSAVTGWAVVVGMPLKEATAGLRSNLAWLVAATVFALIFGLIFAMMIGTRISGSISALIPPARALGSRDFLTIPLLKLKEANELRRALLDAETALQSAQYHALHDHLTGLGNRMLFQNFIERQLAICTRQRSELALLYIDLDGFKAINETHGHEVGDQLLFAVAARINSSVRSSDIAVRLGGDEFAIVLVSSDSESAETFAIRLIEILSEPFQLNTLVVAISASIGIATYPTHASNFAELLKLADGAMYQAKIAGKACVRLAISRIITQRNFADL